VSNSEGKVSVANGWPSNRLPSREHDSDSANDRATLVGFQARVGKEELRMDLENNRRYVQDIEMQRPAAGGPIANNVNRN